MAILRSHGVLLVDSIPTHTPSVEQAKLARLENTLTFYYYDGSSWVTIPLDTITGLVESVTGTNVDNTDPQNPVVNLQTAGQTSIVDSNNNYAGTNVEDALSEIATQLTGLTHTAITGIDLKPTGNANEYTVEIQWTDENGNSQTTTDSNPIVIAGLGTAVQTVSDTNSIDMTKTGTNVSANLKVSATQTGATVSVLSDGLSIEVDDETEPTAYISKAAALSALGAGKKFQYLPANLDGAVEGTVAWT